MSEKKPRSRFGVRFTRFDKWLVYGGSIGVWLSGALWVYFEYFMIQEYEFGWQPHPLESIWQKTHGAFGFLATAVFGLLWGFHIVRAWEAHWQRWSGGSLFAVTLFLIVSGGALYYIGDDVWRDWTGIAHWVVGLAAIFFFFLHWLSRGKPKATVREGENNKDGNAV